MNFVDNRAQQTFGFDAISKRTNLSRAQNILLCFKLSFIFFQSGIKGSKILKRKRRREREREREREEREKEERRRRE